MAGAVTCPSCGRDNASGQRECVWCEAPLAVPVSRRAAVAATNRDCPACRFPVDAEQLECPACGAELEPASQLEGEEDGASLDAREQVVLPPKLREEYGLVEELRSSGGEAELYLVARRSGAGPRRLLKRYAFGRERLDDKTLAELQNTAREHVVGVIDYGRWDGRRWELLEYCKGGSLRDVLDAREGRPLEEREALTIVRELASALTHLHERGFVHRDLKPSNVLVREPWPDLDLVLADFGLVAALDGATSIARSGDMTLAYAAPEAIAQRFGPASDWWSLGVIVMEILLGRHPAAVAAGVDPAMLMIVATKDYDVTVVPGERWQYLCAGLLTRDPVKRWKGPEVDRWLRGERPEIHRALAEQDIPRRESSQASFKFYDHRARKARAYTDPKQLAEALRTNWEAALAVLNDPREHVRLTHYLHNHFPDSDHYVAPLLDGRSELGAEQRLIMLLVLLSPDAPPFFRDEPLLAPDGSLSTTLRPSTQTALDIVGAIYDQDVLGSYAAAENPERPFAIRPLAEINRDWRELMRDADATLARLPVTERSAFRPRLLSRALELAFAGEDARPRVIDAQWLASDQYAIDELTRLRLQAGLPALDAAGVTAIRVQLLNVIIDPEAQRRLRDAADTARHDSHARTQDWFREVADRSTKTNEPALSLVVAEIHGAATVQADRQQREEEARERQRKLKEAEDQKRREEEERQRRKEERQRRLKEAENQKRREEEERQRRKEERQRRLKAPLFRALEFLLGGGLCLLIAILIQGVAGVALFVVSVVFFLFAYISWDAR